MTAPTRRERAFTLIELLIVVAIIGVLVGVAAPNYQNAIAQSKVARFQRDARAAEAGLESFYVDHGTYPYPDPYSVPSDCLTDVRQVDIPDAPGEGYLPRTLTTPVAYLNDLPTGVFENRTDMGSCHPDKRTLLYSTDTLNHEAYGVYFVSHVYASLAEETFNETRPSNAVYMVASPGPDNDRDIDSNRIGAGPSPMEYDPSNGTMSNGDVLFFGPGIGFPDRR